MRNLTIVVSIHIVFLIPFLCIKNSSTIPTIPSQIVVKTIRHKPRPVARKITKKPSVAKAVHKPKKTPPKKNPQTSKPAINRELNALVKQAQQELQKIDKTAAKSKPVLSLTKPSETYGEKIAKHLDFFLILPEYGQVKLTLTLHRMGKVLDVQILYSESDLNEHYVLEEIEAIAFPPFKNSFKGEKEHTFTLTLRNAT